MDIPAPLVTAARSGDRAAASELLERIWPDAYRLARSILGDRPAAEDAAQDACARVVCEIEKLRAPERFAGWFYRIVVNEAKQRRRRMAREEPIGVALGDARRAIPEATFGGAERIDVRRAIDALEPSLRIAIVLRYYYGRNSVEIGRITGCSPVTVRWRLMRAHRRLRTILEPQPRLLLHGETLYADEPHLAG